MVENYPTLPPDPIKRPYAYAILTPSALATLVIFGWAFGPSLYYSNLDPREFIEAVFFINFTIYLFGLPACIWVFIALTSFCTATWLLLTPRQLQPKWRIIGTLISFIPLTIAITGFFFWDYRGP